MNNKRNSDDAPPLSREFFRRAEIREGDRVIRPGVGEAIWRRAEKDMARRERRRLIRNRAITPAPFMKPQLLVKNDDGDWSPLINTYAR